jgi:hypothetical protein
MAGGGPARERRGAGGRPQGWILREGRRVMAGAGAVRRRCGGGGRPQGWILREGRRVMAGARPARGRCGGSPRPQGWILGGGGWVMAGARPGCGHNAGATAEVGELLPPRGCAGRERGRGAATTLEPRRRWVGYGRRGPAPGASAARVRPQRRSLRGSGWVMAGAGQRRGRARPGCGHNAEAFAEVGGLWPARASAGGERGPGAATTPKPSRRWMSNGRRGPARGASAARVRPQRRSPRRGG